MGRGPALSVCIPAYDMNGQGAAFLRPALDSLCKQRFDDFEVVVSDQSDKDDIHALCSSFEDRLSIQHVRNADGLRQGSANCNCAMRHARGRVLKVLFQDDYLCDAAALGQIAQAFEDPETKWCLVGSAVTRDMQTLDHAMVPRYTSRVRYGWNTVSSPSVLAFEAGHDIWFDENLIWLMDADIYFQCFEKFGEPNILPATLVANRIHDGQVSHNLPPGLRRREVIYAARKHGLVRAHGDLRAFLWQYLKHIGK